MSAHSYDVIVVGLGGFGSSAAYHLAKRGARVLGLEQFSLAHARGSSHGETRLIRQAYFESPEYVPLVRRSYELFRELESDTALLEVTGLLLMSRSSEANGTIAARAAATAKSFNIPIERLDRAGISELAPAIVVTDDIEALYEPGAGYLRVEDCVRAHANAARGAGADLRFDHAVQSWSASAAGVEVVSAQGTYCAGALLFAAGAWTHSLLASVGLPLSVHRVMQYWYEASTAMERSPCFAFDLDGHFVYGFPRSPSGLVKCAEHAAGAALDTRARDAHAEQPYTWTAKGRSAHVASAAVEASPVVDHIVQTHLPALQPGAHEARACLYTMTPDEHFIVSKHPEHENVHYASPCSGHGFKFSAALGEAVAERMLFGASKVDLGFLRWPR